MQKIIIKIQRSDLWKGPEKNLLIYTQQIQNMSLGKMKKKTKLYDLYGKQVQTSKKKFLTTYLDFLLI